MLWLLSGQPWFTCWISFSPISSIMYCWVILFALSPFYISIYMYLEMMHWLARSLTCKPNIYVSWSTSELRVRLVLWNQSKPSRKIFLLTVPRRYFFCGSFVFLCLVFLMLLRLFIAALWSPAGKGLTSSWLLLVIFIAFCYFLM